MDMNIKDTHKTGHEACEELLQILKSAKSVVVEYAIETNNKILQLKESINNVNNRINAAYKDGYNEGIHIGYEKAVEDMLKYINNVKSPQEKVES